MNVDVESEPLLQEKLPSVPCFLRRVMEAEKGKINSNMGLTVAAIHAVFLECGFVPCHGGHGYSLPEGCAIASHLVSVMYTLPDLLCGGTSVDVKNVNLKFSSVGNHVSVYGCLVESHPDVHHLSLDSSKVAPLLSSTTNELSEKDEDDVFQLWKTVKDRLSLPLLIDICQKNGLLLPPCFTRLPTDLKAIILEFLPGIDLAKIACTCSELRYLASNDELWRRKFLEEWKLSDLRDVGGTWKQRFALFSWKRKKPKFARSTALVPYGGNPRFMPAPWILGGQRFPMVGGDYDRFPAIGDRGLLRRTGFRRNLVERIFSPNCNLD
ncbi:F-box protein SKIP22 [Platanthera zijinensis]|uniref:F-box protein SKIP22 n=1 Tax=Platanthera zijinensis TaxID=2320716 RepID=A0AAP0BFK8_9ASPA